MNFTISVLFQHFFSFVVMWPQKELNTRENIESSNIDFYTPVASCSCFIIFRRK